MQKVTAAMKSEDDCSCQESHDKSRECVENQRHHFANKGPYSQGYDFSSNHIRIWEMDNKECKMPKS